MQATTQPQVKVAAKEIAAKKKENNVQQKKNKSLMMMNVFVTKIKNSNLYYTRGYYAEACSKSRGPSAQHSVLKQHSFKENVRCGG